MRWDHYKKHKDTEVCNRFSCSICSAWDYQEKDIGKGKIKIRLSLMEDLLKAIFNTDEYLEKNPNIKHNLKFSDMHVVVDIAKSLKDRVRGRRYQLREDYPDFEFEQENNQSNQ